MLGYSILWVDKHCSSKQRDHVNKALMQPTTVSDVTIGPKGKLYISVYTPTTKIATARAKVSSHC